VGAMSAMNSHLQWQWHTGPCSYTEGRMLVFEDCHSQMRRCLRPGSAPVSPAASGSGRRCSSRRLLEAKESEKGSRICLFRSSSPVAQELSRLGSETTLFQALAMFDEHPDGGKQVVVEVLRCSCVYGGEDTPPSTTAQLSLCRYTAGSSFAPVS
jgi:hypothetical protein